MIKVLYAGSPEESGVTLEGLISLSGTDFEIAGVLTNPASAKKEVALSFRRRLVLLQKNIKFLFLRQNILIQMHEKKFKE